MMRMADFDCATDTDTNPVKMILSGIPGGGCSRRAQAWVDLNSSPIVHCGAGMPVFRIADMGPGRCVLPENSSSISEGVRGDGNRFCPTVMQPNAF